MFYQIKDNKILFLSSGDKSLNFELTEYILLHIKTEELVLSYHSQFHHESQQLNFHELLP